MDNGENSSTVYIVSIIGTALLILYGLFTLVFSSNEQGNKGGEEGADVSKDDLGLSSSSFDPSKFDQSMFRDSASNAQVNNPTAPVMQQRMNQNASKFKARFHSMLKITL